MMSDNKTSLRVQQVSTMAFSETLEHITQVIEKAGMTIFAKIDHAANARSVGLQMPPATVLIYGNAKGGTPIMLGSPWAALDLPLRVLVRETQDGKTIIAFHPVKAMLSEIGVPENAAARLEPAQALLSAAVGQ